MSRPLTRTRTLEAALVTELRELFGYGATANAYRKLEPALMRRQVSYAVFRRAVGGGSVTPQQHEAIATAWIEWKRTNLRAGVAVAPAPVSFTDSSTEETL